MDKENNRPEEIFSDDPQQNLRIENEILKLKMQAESGAVFGGDEELSPEIENQFLLQIKQFEDAWKNVKYVKLYDTMGRPTFKKVDEIPAAKMKTELKKLMKLLNKNDINLDVIGEYEPMVIYRFITEELFEHETDDMQLPGWTKNFIYEEFHPNHKMDIEKISRDFVQHWFNKNFDEHCIALLNSSFVLPHGKELTREEVMKKLNDCLACYTSFSNDEYESLEVNFEWKYEENKGLAFAEGMIGYDAEMESGETVRMNGQFKFYMSNENGYWQIFYFVFPGFAW